MSSRKISRAVAAGILAAVLAIPAPAQAEAEDYGNSVTFWGWFAGLWEDGISALWSWSEATQNQGHSIDPNGGTTTDSGTATGQGDEGHGIDPNG